MITARARIVALALVGCHSAPGPARTAPPPAAPDRATVPLAIVGNRPFVDITFRKADGTTKTGRFLVDTGGGGFLIVEPLARELGLTLGPTETEDGQTMAKVTSAVTAFVGELPLALDPDRTLVMIGATTILPPVAPGHADGLLPGHVLAQYHVVFDYPAATFTIARPGALTPRGAAIAMPVAKESGFPRTELTVEGTPRGFLLDTGASFSMVSEAVLKAWGDAHAQWPRHPGAFGEAATLGGQTLETISIPEAQWGGAVLADVGMTSQHEGVFEGWMSGMMAAPIIGSLAGNVLRGFRVELDYPNQKLYLTPAPR